MHRLPTAHPIPASISRAAGIHSHSHLLLIRLSPRKYQPLNAERAASARRIHSVRSP